MSEQEQQQTSQNDEVAAAPVSTQPEAGEAPVAPVVDDKVAETKESVEESSEAAAVTTESDAVEKPVAACNEAAQSEENNSEKNTEATATEQPSANSEAPEDQKVEQSDDKVVAEDKAQDEPAVANGDAGENQVEQPATGGETNGVSKRKAENGAEAVAEDEKSPKKAKVVDDGDQAKVEETAA